MSNSVSKTILVIEDDASVAQMLKDVLQDEGFDVILEPNGEYGLRGGVVLDDEDRFGHAVRHG